MPNSTGVVARRTFGAVGRGGATVGRLENDKSAITDADLAVAGHIRRPLDEERVQRVHPVIIIIIIITIIIKDNF